MAKSIMVQGTMSNVGKSLLAAGLCRVFAQDGYRVAPFKAQNMALNSFITADGLEMGRAQVTQAEAAGVEPDVRMNPILLKPTSDRGSQVILNGRVAGNLTAIEYYRKKKEMLPAIHAAYDSLATENDIIVLEGAGSPAEINLKENDIVNMYMATYARAPVLLAGDIDRGGVFAALYGTLMLLPEDERRMVKGLIINKFRGDPALLRSGLEMLEQRTGCPVMGVVPYRRFAIDDEDSLSERLTEQTCPKLIDIVVIRLPRLSNFTDFNAFSQLPMVSVRYVSRLEDWYDPDMVILPGTKNTMGDLRWLHQRGLAAAVSRHAGGGKPLIGICGGYQMLCRTLSDPHGVEEGGTAEGLGLLDAETVFAPQKVRTRVRGRFTGLSGLFDGLKGVAFEGYEIHMGRTSGALPPLAELTAMDEKKKPDGMSDGNVYGSYVHGLFDAPDVLKEVVGSLLRRKGLDDRMLENDLLSPDVFREKQYDLLADTLRQALDIPKIYRIMERGV